MGKENDVLLSYLEDNERFADVFNNGFFEGRHPGYQHVDQETAEAISVLMGVEILMENKDKYENDGGYNMCQAMRELLEDSRQEGISQSVHALVETCRELGLSKDAVCEKLEQKLQLSQSVAEEYVEKYYV